ncbi:MAG: hypothetical protein M1294_05695 [Firmicutes bacterium]|nr:hypothetical protein [Bacillota bacterium]
MRTGVNTRWDEILALAPQALSLGRLWDMAAPHLREKGHLVVIAQDADLFWTCHLVLAMAMLWKALCSGTW